MYLKIVTKYIRTFTLLKSHLVLRRETCFQGPLEQFVVTTGLYHEMASSVLRREMFASVRRRSLGSSRNRGKLRDEPE